MVFTALKNLLENLPILSLYNSAITSIDVLIALWILFYIVTLFLYILAYFCIVEVKIFSHNFICNITKENYKNRIFILLLTLFVSIPHFIWVKGFHSVWDKIVLPGLFIYTFYSVINPEGVNTYFSFIFMINLFLIGSFIYSYKYSNYIQNKINAYFFHSNQNFRTDYIALLFGNMDKKLFWRVAVGSAGALGVYCGKVEAIKVTAMAREGHRLWSKKETLAGNPPSPEDSVAKFIELQEKAIDDTLVLKAVKGIADTTEDNFSSIIDHFLRNTPKGPKGPK